MKTKPTGHLKRLLGEYEALDNSYAVAWARGAGCEGGKAHPEVAGPYERFLDVQAVLQEHGVL